jgi:hypothetical protein
LKKKQNTTAKSLNYVKDPEKLLNLIKNILKDEAFPPS